MEHPIEVQPTAQEATIPAVTEENKETTSRPVSPWILVGVGGVAIIALAVFLGLNAEKQWGPKLKEQLPQGKPKDFLIAKPPESPQPIHPPIITSTPQAYDIPSPTIEPEASPTPLVEGEDKERYMLPFSGSQAVSVEDLTELTPWELKVARNEIYARHGRSFVHKDLMCYFAKQSWYTVNPEYTNEAISKLESTNATVILNYEKSIDSPLVATDSGCK